VLVLRVSGRGREEQPVERQGIIRKWGMGILKRFLCFPRGELSSQLISLIRLPRKGGKIGAQIKATLRFLFVPALLPAGVRSRQAYIFIRGAYILQR